MDGARPATLTCPACTTTLAVVRSGNRSAHQCKKGHGFFVDAIALPTFFSAPTIKLVWRRARFATTGARFCPRCSRSMTKFDFDGTELDICKNCGGLWFDRGELKTVVVKAVRKAANAK